MELRERKMGVNLMKKYKKNSLYISNLVFLLIGSLLLLLIQTSILTDRTLFAANFHRYIFQKIQLYSYTYSIVGNSFQKALNGIKSQLPGNSEEYTEVLDIIDKMLTQDMITYNINSITDDLFSYLKGKRNTLPDIYLKSEDSSSLSDESYYSLNSADTTSDTSFITAESVTQIEKINSSLILMYFNKLELENQLKVLKLIYFIIKRSPSIMLIFYFLVAFISMLLSRNAFSLFKFIRNSIFISGIVGLALGTFMLIYTLTLLPGKFTEFFSNLSIDTIMLVTYVKDSFFYYSLIYLVTSIALIIIPILFIFIKRLLNFIFVKSSIYPLSNIAIFRSYKRITKKVLIYTLAFTIFFLFSYEFYTFKSDFYKANYLPTFSNLLNLSKSTNVVSAADGSIYALQIKFCDGSTGKAIPNVFLRVTGKSILSEKQFDDYQISDEDGIVKFQLDKGTFNLEFNEYFFPEKYNIPQSFSIDLTNVGTSIYTINLDPSVENIEVEITDEMSSIQSSQTNNI